MYPIHLADLRKGKGVLRKLWCDLTYCYTNTASAGKVRRFAIVGQSSDAADDR